MKAGSIVTVFGASKTVPGQPEFETAQTLGRLLAERGFTVANGGYGGTMLASAKGAVEAGGTVVGVTCRAFKRGKANEYVSEEIATDSLTERLAKLIELGNAYLVLPGGTGTLLELADAWEHKNKGFSNADKPIILVGAFWKPLVAMMGRADADCLRAVDCVESPEAAVAMVVSKLNIE
ncbi:MAG: LOG family protein [Planctomycetales bacterium]|nr:LOG family protein [Planctomycetales bacterium]